MIIESIRNFSIIAHIDHGKSTLADRILLFTKAISQREFREQLLDDMDLERERGITIKARTVRIKYNNYQLNLIDTPGHVDFTYEVSKSLAACEGVLLLVDASQGIEAQTITNLYLALERNITIIPILTKTDLPASDVKRVADEIVNLLGIERKDILACSAKTGEGIEQVLEAIVHRIAPPHGKPDAPLKALVFDSKYDNYRGAVVYVRIMDGIVKVGDKIRLMAVDKVFEIEEIGVFTPKPKQIDQLKAGEVGYICANIKNTEDVKIGDTVTHSENGAENPLPGYKDVKPMVFCGMYPINQKDFSLLRDALNKLRLNDSSFSFEPESSTSLGFGFRVGFLGLLHMDIIKERLEREFDLHLLITAPHVVYRLTLTNKDMVFLDNPTKMPDSHMIEVFEEPYIKAHLIIPANCMGSVMQFCQERRAIYVKTEYLDVTRAMLEYDIPLAEIVIDFYDKIKSMTSGYGSFNYEFIGYKESDLQKLDILINGDPVDALSCIVYRENAYYRGKQLVQKLKEVIPRQMFEVVIQAALGAKVIARDSVRALRKDVIAKCYGGDITRKRKLLEKQKEGKKKMKRIGKVDLPQDAFISVLKINE
ncbi:MAG: elongation factor 4 [Candidatus Omnitrophica bacterium]|nr:elongation factor 4 [Candidatus Omnitrophota bacterium]